MVYDREMGSMRMLLVSPAPRWFLLTSKLIAGVAVSILQVYAYLVVAYFWEIEPPTWWGYREGEFPVRQDQSRVSQGLHIEQDVSVDDARSPADRFDAAEVAFDPLGARRVAPVAQALAQSG